MGLTPVEAVRRAFEIWATRDLETMRELFDPEVVYDCSQRVLNPEVYVGHEGIARLTDEVEAVWAQFDIVFEDLIEVDGERVIAPMTSSARGRASGIELTDTDAATTFTVRGGKIVHAKLYPDRADAFAEAGIPHPESE